MAGATVPKLIKVYSQMANDFGVALAQLNLVVGDLAGNQRRITDAAVYARDQLNCRFVVYPELAICGYPPEDLLQRASFIADCESVLQSLIDAVSGIALVVGHPHRADDRLFNAASLIDGGKIRTTYHKHHLPNYGVFDEQRYFAQGHETPVVEVDGIPIGLAICEDVWEDGPVERSVHSGAKIIFTLNGSPFDSRKIVYRENEIVATRSKSNAVSIVYVNIVGGQDELVFDGGSLVTDQQGEIRLRAKHFEEAIVAARFSYHQQITFLAGVIEPTPDPIASIYSAITLGVRDYVQKNGFRGAVVGLSGGIDSALTLAILVDALGADNVEAVLMPSRFTQQMSVDDAVAQATALGVAWSIISIEPIYKKFLKQLHAKFENYAVDVTEENIQARCRGTLLMGISNKTQSIVITTSNKSEVAVGYSTLYGDMAGGFSAIKDVPKMMVYELAKYRNDEFGAVIPQRVFDRPPSAELAADQKDSDSLPPYEELDEILEEYVENGCSIADIIERGFDAETVHRVVRMVNRNEYKRRQAPPGVRITTRAFGRDRRYPITCRY